MAVLKVPSLQHLARNLDVNSDGVCNRLIKLAENSPTFNYNALFSVIDDLLILHQPYEEVKKGIRRSPREDVRENFLEVLPLLYGHFKDTSPDFVNRVSTRSYAVGPNLLVPFTPPIVYGVGGQLYFPWFSFWRTNPLRGDKLALFTSAVFDILEQDPDLESARFEILDFSAPKAGTPRSLTITSAADIPRLPLERMKEMLAVFADGFEKARNALAGRAEPKRPRDEPPEDRDDLQPDFFD